MTVLFYALDNEFAAATGSNVNAYGTSSIFDYPPNSSMDLVIEVQEGDTDFRLFEIGDTYSVSWGGSGGGGSIQDAVVIRSDLAPDGSGGGIIVFEGVDDTGSTAQIIWTPGFDLEGWYWDNYTPDQEPGYYTYDTQPEYTHTYVCFAAETRIATPYGDVPIGSLRAGHRVMTLDCGAQPLRWIGTRRLAGRGAAAPVRFAAGSIGNRADLRVSQHHRMLVTSPRAELMFGEAEVLVPAKAMVGLPGVTLAPCQTVTYSHLLLAEHHVLFAEEVPCENLFMGPVAVPHLDPDACLLPDGEESTIRHKVTARPVLTFREARALLGLPANSANGVWATLPGSGKRPASLLSL